MIRFQPHELLRIRKLMAEPVRFQLTELETRACKVVIQSHDRGSAASDDYAAIVRHLLDSTDESQ